MYHSSIRPSCVTARNSTYVDHTEHRTVLTTKRAQYLRGHIDLSSDCLFMLFRQERDTTTNILWLTFSPPIRRAGIGKNKAYTVVGISILKVWLEEWFHRSSDVPLADLEPRRSTL